MQPKENAMKMKLFLSHVSWAWKKEPLESEVNAWLEQHPDISIAEIKQSATESYFGGFKLIITLWYNDESR